jgi:hypothetical protein
MQICSLGSLPVMKRGVFNTIPNEMTEHAVENTEFTSAEKPRMSRPQVKNMLVCFFVSAEINKLCFHGAIPEIKLSHHVSKFYFIFIQSSTCFGRHTAHYQEHKTALAASGFTYVEGCWACSCWTLSDYAHTVPESVQHLHV